MSQGAVAAPRQYLRAAAGAALLLAALAGCAAEPAARPAGAAGAAAPADPLMGPAVAAVAAPPAARPPEPGPRAAGPAATPPAPAGAAPRLAPQWGIEVLSVRRSAAGHIIDLRYRVLDAEKAAPFLDRPQRPYLIDQASGLQLTVPTSPKVGPLRQTTERPTAGRVYFILFGNPDRRLGPGAVVTLVHGEQRLENLVVE